MNFSNVKHFEEQRWYPIFIGVSRNAFLIYRLLFKEGYTFQLWLPTFKGYRRKGGALLSIDKPLYPGYAFLSFTNTEPDTNPERQFFLQSLSQRMKDVCSSGFLKDFVVPLTNEELRNILYALDNYDELNPLPTIREGGMVHITAGPFSGFTGKVDSVGNKTVVLLLHIFGREVKVETSFLDVAAV